VETELTTLKSRIAASILPYAPVDRRVIDILRYEFRAARTRSFNWISPAHRAEVTRLKGMKDLAVNIGSGGRGLPGWINIELIRMRDTTICLDVRRPLPLADGSVARIMAEHVVEHMDFRSDIPAVLADWRRVLRPGGLLRIVVPDGARFLAAYASGDKKAWRDLGWNIDALPDDIYTPMHVINHIFHQGGEHLFAYDFGTLAWALRKAGFVAIERMSFRRSRDSALAIDQPNHAPYSLYVEAVKA
jgi:predicted SAM-dependent methyltransferase